MSKKIDPFKQTIQEYLEKRAAEDNLFAKAFAKKGKNIDDCIKYILNTVKKSGRQGFADDEIYSMAVHYYDEDDIKVGSKITGQVVVNHTIELTEKEKEKARKDAIQKIHEETRRKMLEKRKRTKKPDEKVESQKTLF